jgi:hypothetical protein
MTTAMTLSSPILDTRCPLCGAAVLALDDEGHVEAEALTLVPLHHLDESGEAYGICDQCACLTHFPTDLTQN